MPAGVSSIRVSTPRLDTHVLTHGAPGGVPVVFVHGNVSSGRFFAELMASLPPSIQAFAPDLRGFGQSELRPVDATRGVRDFADDVGALLDALNIGTSERPAHVVGWSVGGCIALQLAMDRGAGIASLILEAPMSPFGFGGTKGADGTACFEDWAGTGGGTANPDFVSRLNAKDASADADTSPRNIMRSFYVKPGFSFPDGLEDAYVQAMLQTVVAPGNYPGDAGTSANWPTIAPGPQGVNNAISGQYCDLSGFADIGPRPPVLWIRGADDQIVSDTSLFDLGFLGQLGAVPGWPGADVFPPQPMVGQTRAVLERYAAAGGTVREEVLPDCGHSPHIEKQGAFRELLLGAVSG
ncbi:MAG: alpha/beta hydrolase [Myxococcota bacterium]